MGTSPLDLAHPDLGTLRDGLLPFARAAVKRSRGGKFYPFGGELGQDGSVDVIASQAEPGQTDIQPLLVSLMAHLRRRGAEGALRAGAICFVVQDVPPGATEKIDALLMHVESHAGDVARFFWPFRKGLFGRVSYSDPYTKPVDRLLFAEPG